MFHLVLLYSNFQHLPVNHTPFPLTLLSLFPSSLFHHFLISLLPPFPPTPPPFPPTPPPYLIVVLQSSTSAFTFVISIFYYFCYSIIFLLLLFVLFVVLILRCFIVFCLCYFLVISIFKSYSHLLSFLAVGSAFISYNYFQTNYFIIILLYYYILLLFYYFAIS